MVRTLKLNGGTVSYQRTRRPRKQRGLATKVAKLAKEVNANRPEVKYYVVSNSQANIYMTTSQGINLIGSLAQANGGSGRNGNTVFVKSIRMKLRWVQPSVVGCDRESIGCRVIVARAKQQTFNTALDETYLITDTSQWQSPSPNPTWKSKVDILADKTSILNLPIAITSDFPEVIQTVNRTINKHVTWAQDSDDLMKNGLYAEFFSNQSNYPLTCYYQYVIAYTDA